MNNNTTSNGVTATTLATFEIFQSLPSSDRQDIADLIRTRQYQAGSYIISTLQPTTDVFFLISGQVRVCAFAANGKQVHFEDLLPGQMFGELSAIDSGERSSDCIAAGEAFLAYLPKRQFREILQRYPSVLDAVLMRLTSLIRRQMQRVYEFGACSVNQRIRFELLRLASEGDTTESRVSIDNPPTHADIALRVATHREAVSREIARLQAKDIITWRRGNHTIHDMSALLSLASSTES